MTDLAGKTPLPWAPPVSRWLRCLSTPRQILQGQLLGIFRCQCSRRLMRTHRLIHCRHNRDLCLRRVMSIQQWQLITSHRQVFCRWMLIMVGQDSWSSHTRLSRIIRLQEFNRVICRSAFRIRHQQFSRWILLSRSVVHKLWLIWCLLEIVYPKDTWKHISRCHKFNQCIGKMLMPIGPIR